MRSDRWIEESAASAIFPEQVSATLTRLREKWPLDAPPLYDVMESFPLGPAALLHLFSVSSICAARIANDPSILLWLATPDVSQSERGPGRMLADLQSLTTSSIAENDFEVLRLWKGREMTRLALREVADVATIEATAAELSQLAEICLAKVSQHWQAELGKRMGFPDAQFAILGLGKLGGRELNHSSDVDVIFLYSEEGQLNANLSYHEWFSRLSAKIVETFSATTAAGSLFRIDLRLRPEGSAGPLARSLESMENYYAGFGEAWEQLALVRARGVCGSQELVYEFLRQHQPFIYPKSPTPDLLDEIAAIKERIEREIVGRENLGRNVKLGAGGIREIEFIAQALQLVYGARHAFLQETSTLKTLRALTALDLLPPNEGAMLDRAYRFLRRVEHRLQIEAEQQIHTVPSSHEPLRRLATSLGFSSITEFNAQLQKHMSEVRALFKTNINARAGAESPPPDVSHFRDQKRTLKSLADLTQGRAGFHVAPRTRQVFRKLRPLLLEQLTRAADPDATLNQFVRFVESYGLRSLLFELLVLNPRLLELLVRTFDASRRGGDSLIRRPQLLEEITRGRALDRALTVTEHLERLENLGATATALDPVRAYHQTRWLRILLRDLLSLADARTIAAEHSALAEACLLFARRLFDSTELTIIALGKFGGQEITYGADLDVLFVGDETKAAQNLVVAMAQRSAEGHIATLDARLRPDGEKGPLVCSLATYETYYQTRAQFWELQALTRARPIVGPIQEDFMQMAQLVWQRAGERPDLFFEIASMTARIRRDRTSGSEILDFKTGAGGMVEAEFLVQALQMRHQIWQANWSEALIHLRAQNIMSADQANCLQASYEFLRQCETALRRWENRSVSVLPATESEQGRLACWLGFGALQAFADTYREARENIHVLFEHFIK